MELLFEIIWIVISELLIPFAVVIWGILTELILQVIVQLLIELGFHSIGETLLDKKDRNPLIAFIGYLFLGVLIGGISVGFFPELMIDSPSLALANLVITPILIGLMMSTIGSFLNKRAKRRLRLETFSYGFVFAFSVAMVRYIGTY